LNPITIVAQSIFLAVLLGLLRVLDSPTTATIFAGAVLAVGGAVGTVDWFVRARVRGWRPRAFRRRRDRLLRCLVPGSFGIVALVPLLIPGLPPFDEISVAEPDRHFTLQMAVAASSAFTIIYMSSLVDGFYVVPHLRGDRSGAMPCESSLSPLWRRVTRVWLLHRLVAALGFVASLTTVVALAANELASINQIVAAAIAAAATVLAGFYLTRAPSVIALAISPAIRVGDKVQLAEEFNVTGAGTPSYYVVDVGLEGVSLLELGDDDRAIAGRDPGRSYDRVLDVQDVIRLLRARSRFGPCSEACCRQVNPHCPRRP